MQTIYGTNMYIYINDFPEEKGCAMVLFLLKLWQIRFLILKLYINSYEIIQVGIVIYDIQSFSLFKINVYISRIRIYQE